VANAHLNCEVGKVEVKSGVEFEQAALCRGVVCSARVLVKARLELGTRL
jgi:hypothetical protein